MGERDVDAFLEGDARQFWVTSFIPGVCENERNIETRPKTFLF
jgi:hypothetical protein